jgi:hypothetical protein
MHSAQGIASHAGIADRYNACVDNSIQTTAIMTMHMGVDKSGAAFSLTRTAV